MVGLGCKIKLVLYYYGSKFKTMILSVGILSTMDCHVHPIFNSNQENNQIAEIGEY